MAPEEQRELDSKFQSESVKETKKIMKVEQFLDPPSQHFFMLALLGVEREQKRVHPFLPLSSNSKWIQLH